MSQTEFGALGAVALRAQQHYEMGRRVPNAGYLFAIAEGGVDVLYVLTGIRMPEIWRDQIARVLRTTAEAESGDGEPGEPAVQLTPDPAGSMLEDLGALGADERQLLALFRRADLTHKMRAVAALDADAGRAAP